MSVRPDRPGRLDDVSERSSAQSRRMVDRVEVGGGNGISGRTDCLRSLHCWRGRKQWSGHDEARAAKETDTRRGPMMRISGLLYWRILAAVGTPNGVHSALSGTRKQQEQRDDASHDFHYGLK